jgi:hypothetical protein
MHTPKTCSICDFETEALAEGICQGCRDREESGPSDAEIYGSDYRMPTPMELFLEREGL